MGIVRTVCGDIDSSKLGYTLPHEHVFFAPGGKTVVDDWTLNDWEKSLEMVQDFKQSGGQTIVDAAWSIEAGRSPAELKEVSIITGVNIIAATGSMTEEEYPPKYDLMDVDQLADYFVKEIEVGMDGSTIKAGWIKAGASYMNFTEKEEKVLRAACRAAIKTGAPVHVHTSTGTCWEEMLEVVAEEKLPFNQFGLAHIDRNPDAWVHKQIAKTGAYLIYDGPGKVKYYPDSMRIEILKQLVEEGYGKQIMLSNDTGKRDYHKSYGGAVGTGLTYIKKKFLPRLLEEGFSQETIDDFMINNPATFYSLRK